MIIRPEAEAIWPMHGTGMSGSALGLERHSSSAWKKCLSASTAHQRCTGWSITTSCGP
jgi:hypothetical protein